MAGKIHNSASAGKSSFLAVFSAPRPWLELYCLIPRTGALTPAQTTALTIGERNRLRFPLKLALARCPEGDGDTRCSCPAADNCVETSFVGDRLLPYYPLPPSLPKARLALDKKKSGADRVNNVSSVSTRSKADLSLFSLIEKISEQGTLWSKQYRKCFPTTK